jgi:hypothetical protein
VHAGQAVETLNFSCSQLIFRPQGGFNIGAARGRASDEVLDRLQATDFQATGKLALTLS